MSHIEEIKDKEDFRISEFNNFYRPLELLAFHELFYFNNLNTSRVSNNSSSGSFSGNIKAIILDPFITKHKKPSFISSSNNLRYFFKKLIYSNNQINHF